MPKQLRHEYDVLNFLAPHKDGLTLEQIAKHFDEPPPPNTAARHKFELAAHASKRLRLRILGYLRKLIKTGEVEVSKGVYNAAPPDVDASDGA